MDTSHGGRLDLPGRRPARPSPRLQLPSPDARNTNRTHLLAQLNETQLLIPRQTNPLCRRKSCRRTGRRLFSPAAASRSPADTAPNWLRSFNPLTEPSPATGISPPAPNWLRSFNPLTEPSPATGIR